jgi:hypothetical protein
MNSASLCSLAGRYDNPIHPPVPGPHRQFKNSSSAFSLVACQEVFYSRGLVLPRSMTQVVCAPWAAHTIRAVDGTVRYIPSVVGVVSPAVGSGLAVLVGEFEDDLFEDSSSETFPEASALRGRTVNIVEERELAAGVIGGGGGGGDHRYLRKGGD